MRLTGLGQACDPFASWRLQLPRRKRLPRALSRPEVSSLLTSLRKGETSRVVESDHTLAIAVRLMVSTGRSLGRRLLRVLERL